MTANKLSNHKQLKFTHVKIKKLTISSLFLMVFSNSPAKWNEIKRTTLKYKTKHHMQKYEWNQTAPPPISPIAATSPPKSNRYDCNSSSTFEEEKRNSQINTMKITHWKFYNLQHCNKACLSQNMRCQNHLIKQFTQALFTNKPARVCTEFDGRADNWRQIRKNWVKKTRNISDQMWHCNTTNTHYSF